MQPLGTRKGVDGDWGHCRNRKLSLNAPYIVYYLFLNVYRFYVFGKWCSIRKPVRHRENMIYPSTVGSTSSKENAVFHRCSTSETRSKIKKNVFFTSFFVLFCRPMSSGNAILVTCRCSRLTTQGARLSTELTSTSRTKTYRTQPWQLVTFLNSSQLTKWRKPAHRHSYVTRYLPA